MDTSGASSAPSVPEPKILWERDRERSFTLGDYYLGAYYNAKTYELKKYEAGSDLATAWEYGALLSMQDKLAKLDSSRVDMLNKVIYGLNYYGCQKNGSFFAYVVTHTPNFMGAQPTQYAYDDNAWISIELTRSYQLTGNAAYLSRAEDIMNNLMIGQAWFTGFGGFRWDYRNADGAMSCSTNETVKEFVDLYKITGNKNYRAWAENVYDFMDSHLRDKNQNIYYDSVWAAQEGSKWVETGVDASYYSYNTGTAISAAASLYGITGNARYLNDAKALARGAYNYFGNQKMHAGYVDYLTASNGDGNVWFSTLLLTGFLDLYQYDPSGTFPYIQAFQKGLDYGYEHYRSNKRMPRDWVQGWTSEDTLWSLDESATVQVYAQLALFYQQYRSTDQAG